MIRSLIHRAGRVLAGAAFVACIGPAHAAGITLNDSNCDSFSLTGTPPNQVLSCVVSNVPNCSVSGPSSGTLNTAISLTAVCSGSPTRWVWTGGNTANCSTQICSDTQTSVATIPYTVTATNSVGTGPASAPLNVAWSNAAVQAPSGCSISASPGATLSAAGTVSLTMNCGGGAPTSYAWTGGFAQGLSGQQVSGSISTNTTYSATASNSGGSATASQTVTVGGGSTTPGTCAGFANTRSLTIDWNNPTRVLTTSVGGAGPNDAIVVKFTTGPDVSNFEGNVGGAEWQSQRSNRVATLSASACDFSTAPLGAGSSSSSSTSASFNFTVGANPYGDPVLQPNTTYYLNVKQGAGSTCSSSGNCNMFFQLVKPAGL